MSRRFGRIGTAPGISALVLVQLGCLLVGSGCRPRRAAATPAAAKVLPARILAIARSGDNKARLVLIDRSGQVHALPKPLNVDSFAWSHDGRRVAMDEWEKVMADGHEGVTPRAWLADVKGDGFSNLHPLPRPPREMRAFASSEEWCNSPAWSPNDASLAVNFEYDLWVYRLAAGDFRRITAPDSHEGNLSRPRWSPDGRWIACQEPAGERDGWAVLRLVLFSPNGLGTQTVHGVPGSIGEEDAAWSPDGKHLAFLCQMPEKGRQASSALPKGVTLCFWQPALADVASGKTRRVGPRVALSGPRFSPDGGAVAMMVASTRNSGHLVSVACTGGKPVSLTPETSHMETSPDWSPDGCWIAFARRTGGNWAVVARNLSTGREVVIRDPDGRDLRNPAWQPAGRSVAR